MSPFPVGILQHPYEARNAIATGRMAHLSVTNSHLFVGKDFSEDRRVNALLADKSYRHLMLYPSPTAIDLEDCFASTAALDPRQIFIWVLDAKWQHVNQMLRLSPNIRSIPMIKFKPEQESQFIIRKQPKALCLSTIESIHVVINRYFVVKKLPNVEQQALLDVFQYLVQQQLEFARVVGASRHNYRRGSFKRKN